MILATKPAMRYPIVHVSFAAVLSGVVCLFLFGDLPWDVFSSFVGAFALVCLQLMLRRINPLFAQVVEYEKET